MKLEHTPSKQDVRNKILAQIKAELKHDHRNTHFVTLPAEKWYLEKELLGVLTSRPDKEYALNCYEKDYDIYRAVRESGTLPLKGFKLEHCTNEFISGYVDNVHIVYHMNAYFKVEDLDNREHEKLIVWADYCKTPCNNKKHGYMIDDLMKWMNETANSLFYQTHATNIRSGYDSTYHPAMVNRGLRQGDWHSTGRAFIDHFNDGRTMKINRKNIFDYEYLGGGGDHGRTHMITAGWHTGQLYAKHLPLVKEVCN
jgi:hypothetical protein|tara:strand:- start:436 stop:1200 length:765 start_codon:yes stop_codon:yes gene_type:complete